MLDLRQPHIRPGLEAAGALFDFSALARELLVPSARDVRVSMLGGLAVVRADMQFVCGSEGFIARVAEESVMEPAGTDQTVSSFYYAHIYRYPDAFKDFYSPKKRQQLRVATYSADAAGLCVVRFDADNPGGEDGRPVGVVEVAALRCTLSNAESLLI